MKFVDYVAQKTDWLADYWYEIKMVIYAVFAFLQIDLDIVKILSVLMVIDTILGVIKSLYINKLQFSFKVLLWGIVSKSTILLIPMILALVALVLGFDFKWLVEIVLKILVVSEGISSITNILSIKERKNIENTDYISKLLHGIRDTLNNIISKLFSNLQK